MSQPLRDRALPSLDIEALLRQQTPDAPMRIPRLPAAHEAQDLLGFDTLREAAILLAQAASRTQWTDYNLHDPGVTLLEAFSYALTEDIYASRQSVPELLGLLPSDAQAGEAASRTITTKALAKFALHGPREVLTCRPSTAQDYQRWLYDLWPAARHLQMRPLCDRRQRPTGLWHLSRLAHQADTHNAAQALAHTRAYWGQRNLGEDLLDTEQLLKPRWVRLRFQIRVDGRRDLAELLADLLTRCDDHIAARPRRSPLDDIPSAQRGGGPLMRQGWVSAAELERCSADELKFNDLALSLQDIPGLLNIEQLVVEESPGLLALGELQPLESLPENWNSLPLRGSDWALRMAWPASPEDLDGWSVIGLGGASPMPLQQLWQQLEDVRRTPRREAVRKLPDTTRWDARNEPEPAAYVPASAHLPSLYRAPSARRNTLELQPGANGQRLQWHAYLALLEQWLAHSRAQRQHLGELFDMGRALEASYWWDLPGNAQLPGLEPTLAGSPGVERSWETASEGLYLREREQLERDIFQPADEAMDRRTRVLDQLLAMHGEQMDFELMQGLPCYWSGAAWARHLLRCKQRFARQVLALTGQRSAAFDYSKPLLNKRNNRCPLSLRLALQLGMAHPFPRLLTQTLQTLDLQLLPDASPALAEPPALHASEQVQPLHLLPSSRPPQRGAQLHRLWQHLRERLPSLQAALPPALLRSAVHAERFMLQGPKGRHHLCLAGESRAQQWLLASVGDAQEALQLATELHQLACALQRHAEGLHLVEHVLLRPAGQAAHALAAFHRQRMSLVLPGWTARGADPRFRSLCRDALFMHAPAHLECRVLFLDSLDMARFEQCYAAWLEAKRAHCNHPPARTKPGSQLDTCAAALSHFLQPFWTDRPQP